MTQPTIQTAGGSRWWILAIVLVAAALCICVAGVVAIAFLGRQAITAIPTENGAQNNPNLTNTPVSTNAYAWTLGLSEPPSGFDWQGVPGVSPAFLVPPQWYFIAELKQGFNSYYVTKEKEGTGYNWTYSTGLSIKAIDSQYQTNTENAQSAKNYIDQHVQMETTKKVINSSQNEQGNVVSYQVLIEAEYPDVAQDSPNRKKTVFYAVFWDKTTNALYLVTFESPTPIWEAEWENGQLIIDAFVKQLTAKTKPTTQAAFNTLANTTLMPMSIPVTVRPSGMQPAMKSNLLGTTGGGFINKAHDPGDAWQEQYFLTLEAIGSLPPGAVIQARFENPLDAATDIVVRLYHIPSGTIRLESPFLGGFKCQNYQVVVSLYSDDTETNQLDSYVQWINSQVNLDKVTSVSDFANDNTCH